MQQDTEVINTPMIMERYCSFVNLDTSGTTSKIRKLIKIQPTWAFVLGTSCFVLIVQNNWYQLNKPLTITSYTLTLSALAEPS